MFWVKNTKGKKDAMLTFSVISFFVVVFNIVMATIGRFDLLGFSMEFQPMDSGAMGVFLGATFTAYVSRRATDAAAGAYSVAKKGKDVSEEELTGGNNE